jgi:hypothetical protein
VWDPLLVVLALELLDRLAGGAEALRVRWYGGRGTTGLS